MPPSPRQQSENDPHRKPYRHQDEIWRASTRAPIVGARVDQQPETGNSRVDDAGDPATQIEPLSHENLNHCLILACEPPSRTGKTPVLHEQLLWHSREGG